MVVVADHDERRAGDGAAGNLTVGRPQPGEIPEARRTEGEMRIVGEDRLAAVTMRPVDDPVVRGIVKTDDRRQFSVKPVERQLPIEGCQFRQGRRRVLRVFRIEESEIIGRQRAGQPGAQQFAAIIAGQFEIHQLVPDEAVGRTPRFRPEPQQQELRRQRGAARCKEGVDPGGIGFEPALHRRRQERQPGLGRPVQPQHPHLPVDAQRPRPENLSEPPRAVAPLHLHLEQPVLGVGKTEAEGGILVTPGGDQRDPIRIARNPHLAGQPRHHDAPVELRQRGEQVEITAARDDQHQQQRAAERSPDHPRLPHGNDNAVERYDIATPIILSNAGIYLI